MPRSRGYRRLIPAYPGGGLGKRLQELIFLCCDVLDLDRPLNVADVHVCLAAPRSGPSQGSRGRASGSPAAIPSRADLLLGVGHPEGLVEEGLDLVAENVHRIKRFLGKPESPDVLTKLGTVHRQHSIGKKRKKFDGTDRIGPIKACRDGCCPNDHGVENCPANGTMHRARVSSRNPISFEIIPGEVCRGHPRSLQPIGGPFLQPTGERVSGRRRTGEAAILRRDDAG